MGRIKWYKRNPVTALTGMMGLSLEERGAYNTILDLIYARDGKLIDDDVEIARCMGTDVRVWKRIKARLFTLEKLFTRDGIIHNPTADEVIEEALHRVTSTSEVRRSAAETRWAKSKADPKENKDIPVQDAMQTQCKPDAESRTQSQKVVPLAKANGRQAALFEKPKKTPSDTPEARLYRRGKEVLGPDAGGLIRNILKLKNGNVGKTLALIEDAAEKRMSKEWLSAVYWRMEVPPGVDANTLEQVDMGMNYDA